MSSALATRDSEFGPYRQALVYTPDLNFNSDAPTLAAASEHAAYRAGGGAADARGDARAGFAATPELITVTATDGVAGASTRGVPPTVVTLPVRVRAVNDAPVLAVPGERHHEIHTVGDGLSKVVVGVDTFVVGEDEVASLAGARVRDVDADEGVALTGDGAIEVG